MKRILLTLFMLGLVLGFAQDTLYFGLTSEPTYNLEFKYYYVDSLTIHVEDGLYKLTLPRPLYNTTVWAINVAADSGSAKVWTQGWKSLFRNDTLATTLYYITMGNDSEDDVLHIYGRLDILYLDPQVAGVTDADSTFKFKIEGWAY